MEPNANAEVGLGHDIDSTIARDDSSKIFELAYILPTRSIQAANVDY